jgi:hypothetical protein
MLDAKMDWSFLTVGNAPQHFAVAFLDIGAAIAKQPLPPQFGDGAADGFSGQSDHRADVLAPKQR